MVNQARARQVRSALSALAVEGLGLADVQEAAIELVSRVVPYDATCWAAVDPQTLLPASSVTIDLNPSAQQEALFAEIEYTLGEGDTFAELARREVPVGRLSDLPYGQAARSRRVNELYPAIGVAHDVRVAFVSGGACWGIAGLMRGPGGPDFSAAEADFLATAAPLVGAALRTAVKSRLPAAGAGSSGPVVIVLGADGDFRAATPAARDWLEQSQAARPGWIGIALRGLAAAVSRASSATARVRMRDASGAWVVLRAAPLMDLDSPAERVLVTVEPISGEEVTSLMLSVYALSPREREVCAEVLAGGTTGQIAERLHLSSYTVQDHLKSIFAKVGVRSRHELAGRLRAS
ncbi:helix-turn-helix transcriptional regulator [Nonomuraea sp. NN258]|uniref:helix-turn-helix transcriptional regulator n=1 Tax=Nonomuraea antri TaxID=2730852 RepID=UPI001569A841|nr:helix-turn-helix transcriptional regulator [Nonomuraea antri]NRQ33830.1 helix-turn-helix transcriptional regulator [Nonomuraea antri]